MNTYDLDIFNESFFDGDGDIDENAFEAVNADFDVFDQAYDEAFESGYVQAMMDAGYDYESAVESKTSVEAGAAAVTGISDAIYSFIRSKKVKSSTVISVPNMIKNGVSKAEAIKRANKAVKFFNAHGYISDNAAKAPIDASYELKMTDLTKEGKIYMESYYDACDKITEYDAETGAKKILKLAVKDTGAGGSMVGSAAGAVIGATIFTIGQLLGGGVLATIFMSVGGVWTLERLISNAIHQSRVEKQGKVLGNFAEDLMIDKLTS